MKKIRLVVIRNGRRYDYDYKYVSKFEKSIALRNAIDKLEQYIKKFESEGIKCEYSRWSTKYAVFWRGYFYLFDYRKRGNIAYIDEVPTNIILKHIQ